MQENTYAALRSQIVSVVCILAFLLLALVAQNKMVEQGMQEEADSGRETSAQQYRAPKGPDVLSKAICNNYDVSCHKARETLRVVLQEANELNVEPALAVGLALHESGFRTDARSSTGDHGLLQVNYKWHKGKVRRLTDLYDPKTNVRIGLTYLKSLMDRKGNVRTALRHYNGANGKTPYPDEVLKKSAWAAQFI